MDTRFDGVRQKIKYYRNRLKKAYCNIFIEPLQFTLGSFRIQTHSFTTLLPFLLIFLSSISATTSSKLRTPPLPYTFKANYPQATIKDDIYFVEFEETENEELCKEQHNTFRRNLNEIQFKWLERRSFCNLFNGISFHADHKDISPIVGLDVVKAVWPMISKRLPQYALGTGESASDPRDNHIITGVLEAQKKLKLDGTGIKIGVIDTGIDYTHPYLGGCYKGPGCRVQYGKDLVGDNYDGDKATASPDDDPRDTCGGHGTHVAGIIGANGPEFNGVAPNITFGAYRVFGCGPNARVESDIIIEAMELAYKDGMDIVNLSLGGGSAWAEYPDSVVADKLSSLGVIVIAAAGNDGNKGMFEVASPAIGNNVISVASFDSEKFMARAFKIDSLNTSRMDYTIGPNTRRFNLTNKIIFLADDEKMEGCEVYKALDVRDKIVVTKRGTCNFEVKAMVAQNAGALGLIIINNNPGTFTPLIKEKTNVTIPVVGLTTSVGNQLVNQVKSNPTKMIRLSTPPYFVSPTGGKISSFSSWGPGPELEIKPDLGAPGGLIFSTFPVPLGMYATLSGTSMATPYTAGVVGLLMQHKRSLGIKKISPEEVRSFLQNTSQPSYENNSTLPTSVIRQGSGMINAYNAIMSNTIINPSKLVLNDTYAGIQARSLSSPMTSAQTAIKTHFVVENLSDIDILSYKIDHLPSASVSTYKGEEFLNYPVQNLTHHATLEVENNLREFILSPGQKKRVGVKITPPDGLSSKEYWLFSGYIKIVSNQTSANNLFIPYLGVHGNYTELPILSNPNTNYPKLKMNRDSVSSSETNSTKDNEHNSSAEIAITFQGKDSLNLQVRVEHPTRLLTIKVIDALTKEDLGYIKGGINHYVGRNDQRQSNKFYNFPFSGSLLKTNPNKTSELLDYSLVEGKFLLKVQALKPFGNPKKEESFETWTSPLISLNRMNLTDFNQLDDELTTGVKTQIEIPKSKVRSIGSDQSSEPIPGMIYSEGEVTSKAIEIPSFNLMEYTQDLIPSNNYKEEDYKQYSFSLLDMILTPDSAKLKELELNTRLKAEPQVILDSK